MLRAARTLLSAGSAVPYGSAAVLLAAVRAPRRFIDFCYTGFCRATAWGAGIQLMEPVWHTSAEALPPRLVVVSNHESHLDVPAVFLSLHPRSIRFVAKKELFRIPFLGWGMRATGNISVARHRSAADLAHLKEAAHHGQDGDVLFFAEGTRSPDGQLHEFKKGAFAYAIDAQIPILPVAVAGGYEVLPTHTIEPKPGPVAVVIGEPIATAGLRPEDREALRDRTQAIVAGLREEALQRVGSPRAGRQAAT